jgi:hypothetical protein
MDHSRVQELEPTELHHSNDIDAQKLSAELGLKEYTLPDRYYAEARSLLTELYSDIIPQTRNIETMNI